MVRRSKWFVPAALLGALVCGAAAAPSLFASRQDAAAAKQEKAAKVEVLFLGNEKCPMSDKPVDKTKFVESEGQRVYFCCGNCQAKGKDMAAELVAKTYAQPKAVKNEKCPVSGKALDAEKSVKVSFEGHEVGFCCENCAAKMKKEATLLTLKAMHPKLEFVGNTECPMMGEAVDGQTFASYDGKVLGFCCPKCIAGFEKDPAGVLAKVQEKMAKKDG